MSTVFNDSDDNNFIKSLFDYYGMENVYGIILDNDRRVYFDPGDFGTRVFIDWTKGWLEVHELINDRIPVVVLTTFTHVQGVIFFNVGQQTIATNQGVAYGTGRQDTNASPLTKGMPSTPPEQIIKNKKPGLFINTPFAADADDPSKE